MADRRQPVVQLVDVITAGATPSFKAACRRGADKRGLTLAAYVRAALSERLTVDGVRHRRPAIAEEGRP